VSPTGAPARARVAAPPAPDPPAVLGPLLRPPVPENQPADIPHHRLLPGGSDRATLANATASPAHPGKTLATVLAAPLAPHDEPAVVSDVPQRLRLLITLPTHAHPLVHPPGTGCPTWWPPSRAPRAQRAETHLQIHGQSSAPVGSVNADSNGATTCSRLGWSYLVGPRAAVPNSEQAHGADETSREEQAAPDAPTEPLSRSLDQGTTLDVTSHPSCRPNPAPPPV
jgi:hypothetical protein